MGRAGWLGLLISGINERLVKAIFPWCCTFDGESVVRRQVGERQVGKGEPAGRSGLHGAVRLSGGSHEVVLSGSS